MDAELEAARAARENYGQYYSTQRLRRLAETLKGTRHTDLFASLRVVWPLLAGQAGAEQAAALGLKGLGSFLFRDQAALLACQISNQDFLEALRALSLTYDEPAGRYRKVDYKHLGATELGSVYESLLELHARIDVPGGRFALERAGGHERKQTGSYYTPEALVNALLDQAYTSRERFCKKRVVFRLAKPFDS